MAWISKNNHGCWDDWMYDEIAARYWQQHQDGQCADGCPYCEEA